MTKTTDGSRRNRVAEIGKPHSLASIRWDSNGEAFSAFDLIESKGYELRRDPLEVRKATLASVLTEAGEAGPRTSMKRL